MFVQLIICDVKKGQEEAFSNGQSKWQKLSEVEGFYFQIGGWDVKNSQIACIISAWKNELSHMKFRETIHDRISEESGQARTYHSCLGIKHFSEIPILKKGWIPSVVLTEATFIRIADCLIKKENEDHFYKCQKEIWNPAMLSTTGMLGGYFSKSTTEPNRFIVTTFWMDKTSHQNYAQNKVSNLRLKAQVEKDLESIKGYFIQVETKWNTFGKSAAIWF